MGSSVLAWPQVRTASQLYSGPADAEFLSTLGLPEQPECATWDVNDKYHLSIKSPPRYCSYCRIIFPDFDSTNGVPGSEEEPIASNAEVP